MTPTVIEPWTQEQADRMVAEGIAPGGRVPDTFTVRQYVRMIEVGILTSKDRVELLDNRVVPKMGANPPHEAAILALCATLGPLLPPGWLLRHQMSLQLADGVPEPDVFVARGASWREYAARRPVPADVGLLIEVSDSSLGYDRGDKAAAYARAGVVRYWIVNLPDGCVEVFEQPTPAGYAATTVFRPGESVPLVLDGVTVGHIAVADVLP